MSRHGALYPVLFIAIVGCLITALTAIPAATQQTVTDQDMGALPISLVIDNAMSAHEQDIKDRMLDYEFDNAQSDAAKASIVKERSDELAAEAMDRQAFLEALESYSNSGLIPDSRLKAMINLTIKNIERMTGSSKKLQEKAQKINKHTDTDSVSLAVSGLDNARSLANHVSKAHAGKD